MVGKSTSQAREIGQRHGKSRNVVVLCCCFFQDFGQKRVDNGFGISNYNLRSRGSKSKLLKRS